MPSPKDSRVQVPEPAFHVVVAAARTAYELRFGEGSWDEANPAEKEVWRDSVKAIHPILTQPSSNPPQQDREVETSTDRAIRELREKKSDCGVCGVPATAMVEVCAGYCVPRCEDHLEERPYQAEARLDTLLSTQPEADPEVPRCGGMTLLDALYVVERAIRFLGGGCPDYGEATESCGCLICRTQSIVTEWENDSRSRTSVPDEFDCQPTPELLGEEGGDDGKKHERWTGPADIAWCPEHGLHGARDTCFECGKPVEQIRMIPLEEVGRGTVQVFSEDQTYESAFTAIQQLLHAANPGQSITVERHHIDKDGKWFTVTVRPYTTGVQNLPATQPVSESPGDSGGEEVGLNALGEIAARVGRIRVYLNPEVGSEVEVEQALEDADEASEFFDTVRAALRGSGNSGGVEEGLRARVEALRDEHRDRGITTAAQMFADRLDQVLDPDGTER
jgi:hypothetical protein